MKLSSQNKLFKKLNFFDWAAISLCLVFALLGSIVSVIRFWQYEVFYYDFGIFDSAIWNVAHLNPPVIDHLVVGGKWIFADHFSPGIFIFSPLFWITSRSETLLVAQAVTVALGGFVIYKIGIELTKNKFISLSILIAYFLFLGLQNAVISDFHEVTVATLPLTLTFWAIVKKRFKLYFLFLFLTLLFKESNFILGISIGLFIFLLNKKNWRIALLSIIFSIIYGFLAINIIIPYFAKASYHYSQSVELNSGLITSFFDNKKKIETIFYSFLSFGFLPLFSPATWPLILQDFFTRFYSQVGETRIGLGLHYSALLSVIMAVSSFFGFNLLKRFTKLIKFAPVIIILVVIFLYRFILHGPFALAYNPAFYNHTRDFSFLNELVNKVPMNSIVMTQNNLASHFINKEKRVYLLSLDYQQKKPEYIIFDMRDGQNPNDFFDIGPDKAKKLLNFIREDNCYTKFYSSDSQFIYKRTCI